MLGNWKHLSRYFQRVLSIHSYQCRKKIQKKPKFSPFSKPIFIDFDLRLTVHNVSIQLQITKNSVVLAAIFAWLGQPRATIVWQLNHQLISIVVCLNMNSPFGVRTDMANWPYQAQSSWSNLLKIYKHSKIDISMWFNERFHSFPFDLIARKSLDICRL